MKTAYFDVTGKCLVVQSGSISAPPDAVFSAEIDGSDTPNTLEFDLGKAKVKKKQHVIPDTPEERPKLRDDLALLEARVAALEAMLLP